MSPYAQDMNFKNTTVSIEKSRLEIEKQLKDHGAKNVGGIYYDDDPGDEKLMIGFRWLDRQFQMEFRPIEPDYTRGYKSRDQHWQQAIRQMGRVALNFVKASMLMALNDKNIGLMAAFELLPDGGTIQQLAPGGINNLLKDAAEGRLALPGRSEAS